MPSKTPAQARFMSAVAHGWQPPGGKGPPVSVAREFNRADAGGETLHRGMSGKHMAAAMERRRRK